MVTIAGSRRSVYRLFESLAIIAFVVMLGSSLLQVFFRYVLNAPLMWTEELARLMCVVTTYFGSVVALVYREHIRVDMVDRFVTGKASIALGLFVDVLLAWFTVTLAFGCWLMAKASWATFTASMPWFRTGYLYTAVGIAAVAMTLLLILDIYERAMTLTGRRDGAPA
jgi:TRAP-type transport system small permease protein